MSFSSKATFVRSIPIDTEKAFTEWHTILIKNPDTSQKGKAQRELLWAVKDGKESLANLLKEKLNLRDRKIDGMPSLPRELTPGEAFDPPVELELELWKLWQSSVSPSNAIKPIYWNIAYAYWIEDGFLGDDLYKTLVYRKIKDLEAETRTVLRNLGGLPRARGNVSVLSDCPLARAWWRCQIVHETINDSNESDKPNLAFDVAHRALHRNTVWESFVLNSLRRVTVVNDRQLRFAIIEYLTRPDSKVRDSKTCTQLIRNLAQLVLGYSPSLLDWKTLSDLVQKAAEGIDAKSEPDSDEE